MHISTTKSLTNNMDLQKNPASELKTSTSCATVSTVKVGSRHCPPLKPSFLHPYSTERPVGGPPITQYFLVHSHM